MNTNPTAFVLMPFAEEFDEIYDYLIKGAVSEAGYKVTRADDIRNQRSILADVIQSISNCDLVIADLSTSNANVYYELGLAHAFRKPVILLAQDINEVPFDLQSYRILTYAIHFTRMNEARNELQILAKNSLEGTVKFGSPVSDFINLSSGNQNSNHLSVFHQEINKFDDRGILDFQAEIEDGFAVITTVIGEVGERLNVITPEINVVGEQLQSSTSTSKRRSAIRTLAASLENYAKWLHQGNARYREALGIVSGSLNALFSGEFTMDQDAISASRNLVLVLQNVEQQAHTGQESIAGLVSILDSLPRLEKEFNQAKRGVSNELKELIGNVEQTVSTLARARNAATQLLDKYDA